MASWVIRNFYTLFELCELMRNCMRCRATKKSKKWSISSWFYRCVYTCSYYYSPVFVSRLFLVVSLLFGERNSETLCFILFVQCFIIKCFYLMTLRFTLASLFYVFLFPYRYGLLRSLLFLGSLFSAYLFPFQITFLFYDPNFCSNLD